MICEGCGAIINSGIYIPQRLGGEGPEKTACHACYSEIFYPLVIEARHEAQRARGYREPLFPFSGTTKLIPDGEYVKLIKPVCLSRLQKGQLIVKRISGPTFMLLVWYLIVKAMSYF